MVRILQVLKYEKCRKSIKSKVFVMKSVCSAYIYIYIYIYCLYMSSVKCPPVSFENGHLEKCLKKFFRISSIS